MTLVALRDNTTIIADVLTDALRHGHDRKELAREIEAALSEAHRLLPPGMVEVSRYHDYRWRHRLTGEVQEALHARHSPEDWVQDRRLVVRARGDWEQIN